MIDLSGKVALITGSSRGIGHGCALAMARAGARIVVNYNSHPEDGESVAQEVRDIGAEAMVYGADVSQRAQVDAMVDATVERFGRLDIAVANAYYSKREPFLELSLEGVQRTLNVTLLGAFHTAQASARQMVAQGEGGSLLFISSVLAQKPFATSMPYNAAKAGMNQMARTIANELIEHRIRANVIEPGWTDTPGERQFASEEEIRQGGKGFLEDRLGSIDDLGNAATFLCSDAAAYITGTVLQVDGGYCLRR